MARLLATLQTTDDPMALANRHLAEGRPIDALAASASRELPSAPVRGLGSRYRSSMKAAADALASHTREREAAVRAWTKHAERRRAQIEKKSASQLGAIVAQFYHECEELMVPVNASAAALKRQMDRAAAA